MTVAHWKPGDAVVWRSRPYGQVGYVMPARVVLDTPDVTVLFQAPGSICKRRAGARGGPRGRGLGARDWDGTHEDRPWDGMPNLRLHQWGTSYAIIRSWDATRDAAHCWYINLEAPWRRTAIGFDTQDLVLDITVADDLSSWAWKDEDELAWSIGEGRFSEQEAAAIRAEGLRAVRALEQRSWPFCVDWSQWRPDLDWDIPVLPPNWADPSL
jgi:hypothetical protein